MQAPRLYQHPISLLSLQEIWVSARRSLKCILVATRKGFAKAETQISAARLGSAEMVDCGVAKLGCMNHYISSLCSYHSTISDSNEKGK